MPTTHIIQTPGPTPQSCLYDTTVLFNRDYVFHISPGVPPCHSDQGREPVRDMHELVRRPRWRLEQATPDCSCSSHSTFPQCVLHL